MKLPNMVNSENTASVAVSVFGGLDKTQGSAANELTVCENLSHRGYPALAPRAPRVPAGEYMGADGLFIWNGRQVVTARGVLYYDGEALTNVSVGEHQFAVVNTKLIIYPDKIYIDLVKGEVVDMAAQFTAGTPTPAGDDSLDTWSLTGAQREAQGRKQGALATSEYNLIAPKYNLVYTYGKDSGQISCTDGVWTLPTPTLKSIAKGTAYPALAVGDIVIPSRGENDSLFAGTSVVWGMVCGDTGGALPDTEQYNTLGYYAVVTDVPDTAPYIQSGLGTAMYTDVYSTYNVYSLSERTTPIDKVFHVSDVVELQGMAQDINNVRYATVTAVTPTTITFAEGTVLPVNGYYDTGALQSRTLYKIQTGSTQNSAQYSYILFDGRLSEGSRLYRVGGERQGAPSQSAYYQNAAYWFYDAGTRTRYIAELLTEDNLPDYVSKDDAVTPTFTAVSSQFGTTVTLKRNVPDMEYICSHNNRLYGVSNHEATKVYNYDKNAYEDYDSRVIYISALGYPEQFYTFEGVDSDSYQVAVASDGDFTGICEYGGDVICFKEDRFYRVYGDYPSAFGYNEYIARGVKNGSYKSLVVLDESLYYHSPEGVCVYSGGVPALLSYKLGADEYSKGIAGGRGRRYYISLAAQDGRGTYVYDTAVGTWLMEGHEPVQDFAQSDGLFMLAADKVTQIDGNLHATTSFDITKSYGVGECATDGEKTLLCKKRTVAAVPPQVIQDDRHFKLKLTGGGWNSETYVTVNGGKVYGAGEYNIERGDEISLCMTRTGSWSVSYATEIQGTGKPWWKNKTTFTAVGDVEVALSVRGSASGDYLTYTYSFDVTRSTAYPSYMVSYEGANGGYGVGDSITYGGVTYTLTSSQRSVSFPITAGESVALHVQSGQITHDGETVTGTDYTFAPAGDVEISCTAGSTAIETTSVPEYVPGNWKASADGENSQAWSSTADYEAGDVVRYEGSLFECVKDVQGGTAFAVGDYWTAVSTETVDWSAEFAPWTDASVTRYTGIDMERKVWRWLRLRVESETGAELTVSVRVDNGAYEKVHTARRGGWYTLKIPIPPRRTDALRIKLEGRGNSFVHRLDGICDTGSDYYG